MSRQSRVVLAGSLAIALAILAAGAIAAAELTTLWRSLDARGTELAVLQRRLSAAGQAAPSIAGSGPFLDGATFSLAANALQRRLVGLIEASGGTLLMASVEAPTVDGQADHRATVQALAEMTNDGLQQVLYALESELPLVMVTSLTVESSPPQTEGATPATGNSRLRVDLRVIGHFYAGGR
jgi:hypothetical protein